MSRRPSPPSTSRTRIRRVPERGRYDAGTVTAILDEALVCHVGFVSGETPYVIPMACARDGERLLLHGSSASRMTRALASGAEVCVTVTHLDGVILARAAFDNSMNYRSAIVIGRAEPITDPGEKLEALQILVEKLIPGRWREAREPNDQELRATTVLALPITEASAKVRSGPPKDDDADLGLDVWAGEIPMRMVSLDPIRDPLLDPKVEESASVQRFRTERVPPFEESQGP